MINRFERTTRTKEANHMSKEIIQFNEGVIKEELRELVLGSVEETLNNLLEKEAQELTQAARHERTQNRQGYRAAITSET
jgi:putative transposase